MPAHLWLEKPANGSAAPGAVSVSHPGESVGEVRMEYDAAKFGVGR